MANCGVEVESEAVKGVALTNDGFDDVDGGCSHDCVLSASNFALVNTCIAELHADDLQVTFKTRSRLY